MKKQFQNTTNSQLDKANKVLVDLAPNVTTKDRFESGFSEHTIVQYLKGRGKDLGTAMALIDFFQNRIGDRDKKLESAT